jgi:hypothetical protein
MRKLKIIEHISLDGVIQAPGGPTEDGDYPHGGWTAPYHDPAVGETVLAEHAKSFVYPVLLGKGKRFFSDGTPPRELALTSTKAAGSGVIISTYRPAGTLRTGSF